VSDDLRRTFTAIVWCETGDDEEDPKREAAFDHADDAADAAFELMEAARKQGRLVQRYGWTLKSGHRPGLPGSQSWPCHPE